MSEFFYLFIVLTITGALLLIVKQKLELELERKFIHYTAWTFVILGGFGSILSIFAAIFIDAP
jgi:hypothetical protein